MAAKVHPEPVKFGTDTIESKGYQDAAALGLGDVDEEDDGDITGIMLRKGILRRPRLGLHEAIHRGQVAVVRQICRERCGDTLIDESSLTGSSGWNESPLMVAVQCYHLPTQVQLDIIDHLLRAGARLDLLDKAGRSPLALAVKAAPDNSAPSTTKMQYWLERGDGVLIRTTDPNVWREATIISCNDTLIDVGGVTVYDVKFEADGQHVVMKNTHPLDICPDTPYPREIQLGMTVLFPDYDNEAWIVWRAGVVTAFNPRGGFDIRLKSRSSIVIAKGLNHEDIRVPMQPPNRLRGATEGRLFPGCSVEVFLPGWMSFRTGMIQGRNTLQGGFNVLLRDKVHKETGELCWNAKLRWNKRLNAWFSGENLHHLLPDDGQNDANVSSLLVGVHLEWIRLRNIERHQECCCPLVMQRLSEPRRVGNNGMYVARSEFESEERWDKAKSERPLPHGVISKDAPLSGSQVVALAARHGNLDALKMLVRMGIVNSICDLHDWVDGLEAIKHVTDPDVLRFFLHYDMDFPLARAVRLSQTSKAKSWNDVVAFLISKKKSDPFFWTETSPPDRGLSAVGWACKLGRMDILQLLLSKKEGKAIARQPHKASQHPLYITVKAKVERTQKLKMVHLLIKNGVMVENSQALWAAVEENLLDITKYLLQMGGACATQKHRGILPQCVARDYRLVLALMQHSAADGGDMTIDMLPVTIVARAFHTDSEPQRNGWLSLLSNVVGDWQAWDDNGDTALSLAVAREDLEVVKLLLEVNRCNPNVRTASGEYPIGIACGLNQDIHVASELLNYEHDESGVFLKGTLALPRVCQRAHRELLDLLLDHHKKGCGKRNILNFEETMAGKTSVELILEQTSDNVKDMVMALAKLNVNVQPALVAERGWRDVLKEALTKPDKTMSAPVPTPGKVSALMHAIHRGDAEMVELLVGCGADLLQTSSEGKSVLVMAIEAKLDLQEHYGLTEETKNNIRFNVMKELLKRKDAVLLIQANGVLAAAAKLNCLEVIKYLNEKVGDKKWCEEDEMDIDPETGERVSPVALATDQRVQLVLIQQNGLTPNLANLAREGKFDLVVQTLKCFMSRCKDTREYKQKWNQLCGQKSTNSEKYSGYQTGRTVLGWLFAKRFEAVSERTSDLKRGITAFKLITKDELEQWGVVKPKPGWVKGIAKQIDGVDSTRYKPQTPDFMGLVQWSPLGLSGKVQILPFHELLFEVKNDGCLEKGRSVLIKSSEPQLPIHINLGASMSKLYLYQKMYITDSDEDSTTQRCDTVQRLRGCTVTKEGIRKTAGQELRVYDPITVSESDVVSYSKFSDVANEEAAIEILEMLKKVDQGELLHSHFRDEDGVSILELAARGGDLNLVNFVLNPKYFPSEIVNPPITQFLARRASISVPGTRSLLDVAVTDLQHPCSAALCAAAAGRRYHIVQELLKRADPSNTKQGKSVGKWAASESIVRLLRDNWSRLTGDVTDHLYDLCMYARRGWNREVITLLDEYQADVNTENSHGSTPLMETARGGHVELFKQLLSRRAIVDKFDRNGRSVLSILCGLEGGLQDAGLQMVEYLFQQKGLEFTSSEGDTEPQPNNEELTSPRVGRSLPSVKQIIETKRRASSRVSSSLQDRAGFVRRSKALTVAVSHPSPSTKMIELLLENFAQPDEQHLGKAVIRHITKGNNIPAQCAVAKLLLRKLLEWKIVVSEPKSHLYRQTGDVISLDEQGQRYKVHFSALTEEKWEGMIQNNESNIEWVNQTDVENTWRGPASCGRMLHVDFMHVVGMAWPEVVGLMIDLDAIEGYHMRTLPYICGDSLKSALLQSLQVLRPRWEYYSKQGVTDPDVPPEWYVLRHLLRGLNKAHSVETVGPTLQQAVNELLEEEKYTLGLLPLELYKEAIVMTLESQTDMTFFSELFMSHQHLLKVDLCIAYSQFLTAPTNSAPPPIENLEIFKSIYNNCKEFESAACTLEIAAEYGWVEAVEWLVKDKKVSANFTHTANKPIRTVALEISKQIQELAGENLERLIDNSPLLTGTAYVELMRDRDVNNKNYFYRNSLDDVILESCRHNRMMIALVEIALILFSNGANAEPDDFERLSQVMRLDHAFDAMLDGSVAHKVSLLHVAAACNNAKSVQWLLNNDAYRDTVGSGIMEDKNGRTARHYTSSHDCHVILGRREQEQQQSSGYMPPDDQIDLVIALKVRRVLDFDLSKVLKNCCPGDTCGPIGVNAVLHGLNCLDLGGFIVDCASTEMDDDGDKKLIQKMQKKREKKLAQLRDSTIKKKQHVVDFLEMEEKKLEEQDNLSNTNRETEPKLDSDTESETEEVRDVYVVVSGSERRQLLTCKRYPYLRCGSVADELLSKEKHSISANIVNSFSWPILDLKLHTAGNHITEAVLHNPNAEFEDVEWIRSKQWQHYGHYALYPLSVKVACSVMQVSGDYEFDRSMGLANPRWKQVNGQRKVLKEDSKGRWGLFANGKCLLKCTTPHNGRPPTLKEFEWLRFAKKGKDSDKFRGGCWKIDQVTITPLDEKTTEPKWVVVDECSDIVYALLTDRQPQLGRPSYDMARRLEHIVASLPDGTPEKFRILAPAFKEIDGVYCRDDVKSAYLFWTWTNTRNGFKLKTRFTRAKMGDAEESLGITGDSAGISSLWTISHQGKEYLEMRSNDVGPWHDKGIWVNTASKTPTPSIDFIWEDSPLTREESKTLLERKTRALWGLRQILTAAGMGKDDLPFRATGRLEPDAPHAYKPPNFDTSGNLPPGQKWLDLLVQETRITQVFGVHNDDESQSVLNEWQPDIRELKWKSLLRPWCWQPFCSLKEFLYEVDEMAEELKFDPCTKMVCDRKTFLNLEPLKEHTSTKWEALQRLQKLARDVPFFKERSSAYMKGDKSSETLVAKTVKKGTGVMVHGFYRGWANVSIPMTEWWLPVTQNGVELLTRSGANHYRARFDIPYYNDKKDIQKVDYLKRGSDIEVIHLDLEGKWARVHHHGKAVYFTEYWMPEETREGIEQKNLKPFYLSQLTKLEAYIGSKIAFYFAFTACYCSYLLLLFLSGMVFTIVQSVMGLYESESVVIWNAFVVLIWASAFRQRWMRKASELAYMWNVRNVEQWEPPMAEFLKRNIALEKRPHPITGLSEPYFTPGNRRKRFLLSIIITSLMASCVVMVMVGNVVLRNTYGKANIMKKTLLGVQNAVSVTVLDVIFALIAEKLNEYENHRTKSSRQNSAIMKNFIFRFINGFSGLMITVWLYPERVCDCAASCDTACKLADMVPPEPCPSVNFLRRCTSTHRQTDLMVQLTTQLVIQSVFSVLFEKVLPKIILGRRQARKKMKNKQGSMFPQSLGCLKVTSVKGALSGDGLFSLKKVKHIGCYKYRLATEGNWSSLVANTYNGEWELEDDPDTVFELEEVSGKLLCKVKNTRECIAFHLPLANVATPPIRHGYWASIRGSPNKSILQVIVEEGTQPVMLKKTKGDTVQVAYDAEEKPIPLAQAVFEAEALKIGSDELAALQLVLFGAFAYLDSEGNTVAVNSVAPAAQGEKGLAFDSSVQWRWEFTKSLWQQGRFQPVTLKPLREAGARWYCWLLPYEELEGEIAGEPLWMTSVSGSFVYLFDPSTPEEYTPSQELPPNPPHPHPLDRFFSIRRRQTDSKMTIVMETMKPPISEENEFNDYTMMMLQFSYVVCFASVLPLAPLVALITGTIELHTDILKFLKLTQRPEATKASGIGAWLTLLTAIIYVSIPVNVLVVLKGHGWRSYATDSASSTNIIIFLGIICVLVAIVTIIRFVVPPIAYWVSQHELRRDYERLQDDRGE